MSDIFEKDIEDQNKDQFEDVEDSDNGDRRKIDYSSFTYPKPLYCTKLEYSSEQVFATANGIKDLKAGDYVIIPTRYGKDISLVLGTTEHPVALKPQDIVVIERKADAEDIEKYNELKEKEKSAFKVFREKVEAHSLDMKLIQVHFLLEESKALFFFSSENRVDFRELVKDLVSVFKMRIELRQIGVRDESRIIGGLGVCGRPYCCHGVCDRLQPVSIKMAKDQNLSLNSMKISGQCGRLLCCLAYESDWYAEARRNLPFEGLHLYYDGTNFRITDVNPLTNMIKMAGEDGRILEVSASRFKKDGNGKWRLN